MGTDSVSQFEFVIMSVNNMKTAMHNIVNQLEYGCG